MCIEKNTAHLSQEFYKMNNIFSHQIYLFMHSTCILSSLVHGEYLFYTYIGTAVVAWHTIFILSEEPFIEHLYIPYKVHFYYL